MAIERTVETNVYCDICGEWIMGWRSNDTGVSKVWASYYARKKAVQSEKRSLVKTAESKKHFRHVVCSTKSEMQDETTMACVGDLKCWNVNDALHVHLMSLL